MNAGARIRGWRSVVDLAVRDYGMTLKYDHSSVIRWLNGQQRATGA